jgi:hypothetical protein
MIIFGEVLEVRCSANLSSKPESPSSHRVRCCGWEKGLLAGHRSGESRTAYWLFIISSKASTAALANSGVLRWVSSSLSSMSDRRRSLRAGAKAASVSGS